jgi:RNA polymerase sigma-70 factor (ECF subfamily)
LSRKSGKKPDITESVGSPFSSYLPQGTTVSDDAPSNTPPDAAAGAIQVAFARHQDELLGTLFYLVGNREDARDALQETFIKCWRHRHEIGQIQNLRAWIFRIALNTGRDLRQTAWRRRRRSLAGEEHMIDAALDSPETAVARSEQIARLREAIRELRSEEQEVFLLRQNGDLTYEQIADAIGIPVGTVKTRMRLALTRLRKALN